ncbi:hypothetical protein Aduo_000734 [Ancylostoma duodenale]
MASVLNEDDLLRTPEEVDPQDEMDLEEVRTNDSVSALYNKEFEKLAAKILAQLNMVGITCDSELGKSMHADDPRRECILASVQEQTAVAKEIVKGTLAELHDLGCPQVGADLIEALRQSRIYKGTQLQKRLERHKALRKMIQDACKTVGCPEQQISERIQSLIADSVEAKRKCEYLRDLLKQNELQMEHLRQQVEELGHAREADMQQKSGIEQRPPPVEGLSQNSGFESRSLILRIPCSGGILKWQFQFREESQGVLYWLKKGQVQCTKQVMVELDVIRKSPHHGAAITAHRLCMNEDEVIMATGGRDGTLTARGDVYFALVTRDVLPVWIRF